MDRRAFLRTSLAAIAAEPLNAIRPPAADKDTVQSLPRVEVHSSGHYLQTDDGHPRHPVNVHKHSKTTEMATVLVTTPARDR